MAGDLLPTHGVAYHTQDKNHRLKKCKQEKPRERCVQSTFPAGPWLRSTRLLAPDPGQAASTPARQFIVVFFSYLSSLFFVVCFCFVLVFFCLFKKLRVWATTGKGEGRSSPLLHTGRWTGQLIEEQIGVAGAHLAGGHGCDTGVVESVPLARRGTSAVGGVMAAHGGSGVIGHSVQVVNSVVGVF